MLFYITILLNLSALGVFPSVGWMQDTVGYETKEICEQSYKCSKNAPVSS